MSILALLSRQFTLPVLVANLIAWFAVNRWLDGFAYRIDLNPLTFLIAGLAVLWRWLSLQFHCRQPDL